MIRGRRGAETRRYKTDLERFSGVKPLEAKCKLGTRPGQHGAKPLRTTEYAIHLRAKQMVREKYIILERQFKRHFNNASRMKGSTGENLLRILESRLDNVVYRLGFAVTRAEAAQLIAHACILINGEVVDIRCCLVEPGDVIAVREKAKKQLRIQMALALAAARPSCDWIAVNTAELSGEFKRFPDRSELPPDILEQLIVEFYSKH